MGNIAKRLLPGQDLREELASLALEYEVRAGVILSAVGSLSFANLRNAGATGVFEIQGPLAIVSATGTICSDGMHVHVSVSDETGRTIGGHLLPGCTIGSTVEIVIGTILGIKFSRHLDSSTGYAELVVQGSHNDECG